MKPTDIYATIFIMARMKMESIPADHLMEDSRPIVLVDPKSKDEVSPEIGPIRLKRQLGVFYGVVVIIGLSVGGGIYISPQTVLKNAGSRGLTLIIWLIGGLNALFGALVFAEIGIQIPLAGEGYPYLYELYNPFIGFVYAWQYLLLVRPGSSALKFIIFGRYLLKPMFQNCEIPELAILLLASLVSVIVMALNCMNLKFLARGQSIFSGMSVATLTTLAAIGMYCIGIGRLENLADPFKDSFAEPGGFVMALYATMYAYSGWSALNFIIEEINNPNKTLPVAIVISNILLTVLYVSVNFTYLVVLDKAEALSSEAVAISAVMKFSVIGGWVMSILIALTACSSCNSGHLVASRMAFAASRNGHFPVTLSYISVNQLTPIVSVIFIGVGILFFIWSFEIEFILANIMFSGVFCDLLIVVGYIVRRLKNKSLLDDKFRVSMFVHVSYGLSLFLFTIIALFSNIRASATGCVFLVFTATIYYLLFVQWKIASKWKSVDKINSFIKKLLNCADVEKDH